jgi:hypothetical protein
VGPRGPAARGKHHSSSGEIKHRNFVPPLKVLEGVVGDRGESLLDGGHL